MKNKASITPQEAAARNNAKKEARTLKNMTFEAKGSRYFDRDSCTFGFQDIYVWNPTRNRLEHLTANDEDRFLVTAETMELAISEFWRRWKIFVQRAYRIDFLRIGDTLS